MSGETVTINVELTKEEAWQLAQFYKRLRFDQARENACDDDEAYTMLNAMAKVGQALAEKGYAPR